MSDIRHKLDFFTESILHESGKEADRILNSLHARCEAALQDAEREIEASAEIYKRSKISEITSAEHRRVSAKDNENRHQLLQFRENCAYEIFNTVLDRIESFVASAEYPGHMAGLLVQAMEQIGNEFSVQVLLRQEDMGLAEELRSKVPAADITFAEGGLSLGGLILLCPDRGIRVDMSFQSSLDSLRGRFSDLSEMYIE